MNYQKLLPAVALTLGVTVQLAANAEVFQMNEVTVHGTQVAAAESKCGAGACGAAKADEHKCGGAKGAEHKCGAAAKSDEHKCGGAKSDEHKCGAKSDDHVCGGKKQCKKHAEHKCASKMFSKKNKKVEKAVPAEAPKQ